MSLHFEIVWFDSMGAKSSCVLVKTPDVSVLIDPGVAIMHPGFPSPYSKKIEWRNQAYEKIKNAFKEASVVIISHYHYDHYFHREFEVYRNKLILIKNPNEYINDSQRKRAENFFGNICEYFGRCELQNIMEAQEERNYPSPLEELSLVLARDFGDYGKRKKELLEEGIKWFKKRVKNWNRWKKIPEVDFGDIKIRFPEGKIFTFGETRLRFTKPFFHGIEFSRLGWVFATVVEYKGKKLIHSSDLSGPIIEDYAEWIIRENPNILILDGPMSYLLGYVLNKTNLERALHNAVRILKETDTELIIYDHHLPREARFREHTEIVWRTADECGKNLITAQEYLGGKPRVLEGF